jgi:hypothetical protein
MPLTNPQMNYGSSIVHSRGNKSSKCNMKKILICVGVVVGVSLLLLAQPPAASISGSLTLTNDGVNVYVSTNLPVALSTNSITPPTAIANYGILWNSNSALYWVTTSHTNRLSAP